MPSEWEKTIVEGNSDAFVDTDPVDDVSHMRDFYAAKAPEYDGKITVPVLFDKKTGKIISTDSMSMAKAVRLALLLMRSGASPQSCSRRCSWCFCAACLLALA